MKVILGSLAFCVIVAGVFASAAPDPQPQPDAGSLAADVAGLNRSLRELVELTRRDLEYRETEVLLRRADMKARRLQPLEDALRSARAEREGLDQELAHMGVMLEAAERGIEAAGAKGIPGGDAESLRMKQEVELRRKILQDRAWNLDQKIIDMDQERREASRLIDQWEELIDAKLGLR